MKTNITEALIFANGEICNEQLIGKYLFSNPLIIALDSAVNRLKPLNIVPDVLIGDFDREFQPHDVKKWAPEVSIFKIPEQESTDLNKAIDYCCQHNIVKAVIFWATGKRGDHNFCNIADLARYRDKIKLSIIDDYSNICLLPRKQKFSQFFKKGTIVSLIPLGIVEGITTNGLKYDVKNTTFKLGFVNGNSNETIADGIVEISYNSGDLLLMECND